MGRAASEPGAGVVEDRGAAPVSRRAWLAGAIAAGLAGGGGLIRAQSSASSRGTAPSAEEERVLSAVRERAKKARLGDFQVRWTGHFLGVGDAPADEYIASALGVCESFSRDFLEHFRERGFPLAFPSRRMIVVALRDADSYQAYSGGERNTAVGGHYDVDTNELVVFDFRGAQAGLAAQARRVNTFTLVHETAHLLCYNTGLLPTGRDIPVAVSEGLATYAELWARPRDRGVFGRANHPRLAALDAPDAEWIPIGRLVADDEVFDGAKTADMAYAESWLLAHALIRQPDSLPKFRAYLSGMPKKGSPAGREAYAASVLGPMRELDAEIRRYARRARSRR